MNNAQRVAAHQPSVSNVKRQSVKITLPTGYPGLDGDPHDAGLPSL